ncbi:MAG: AraC family transcriptional regulator [Oricola sp.]
MIVFDCNDVASEDRFSYWAEAQKNSFYATEVTRPSGHTEPFFGRAEGWQVADTIFGRQKTGAYRCRRTARLIGERELGMFIIGHPRKQPIEAAFEQFPALRAQADDMLVFDADIEWTAQAESDIDYEAILVPRYRVAPYLGEAATVRPRIIATDTPLYGMLRAGIAEFVKLKDAPAATAEGAIQVLAHLIALCYGFDAFDDEDVGRSVASARLKQASHFIAANYHDPRLNAQTIAAHLGISVRRLHAVYEASGGTVSRHILSARIQSARELLATGGDRPVLDIALACGFYSHSTFYRCFVDATGMTPGEFRRSMLDAEEAVQMPTGSAD